MNFVKRIPIILIILQSLLIAALTYDRYVDHPTLKTFGMILTVVWVIDAII